ncbi:MAG: endopeptidase La [Bilifractor sp.]|jgi:ATP-dependent Lon protease
MNEETLTLPCVPLRGIVVLPEMIVQIDVSRKKSLRSVEDALLHEERLFVVRQRDDSVGDPDQKDLFEVGMIVRVRQAIRMPKGITRVQIEAVSRAQIARFESLGERYIAVVCPLEEPSVSELETNQEIAMYRTLSELTGVYAQTGGTFSPELSRQILGTTDIFHMANLLAVNIPMEDEKKQKILETRSFQEKYQILTEILANEIEISKIRREIRQDLKERIDKNQREYILREQIKLIREELGEDNFESEIDRYREKAKKLNAPKEVKEKIGHEIERLKTNAGSAAEAGVIRGYLDTLLSLPWNKMSRDNRDLKKARKILEEDHYGLEKVKERILEYLAVRILTKKGDAPILCLVGPPGTGKTSVARSVARALNKKFVRMSLGGVRDEAEIRGHRRTYVGAMPGRIAGSLQQAGVKNPLILLDEIDKTSGDFRGSIASALLEVLDPEENSHFADHYVELPIDLSEVLFIATANDLNEIPQPLLDRMEVIEISSYTENEKLHIAKEHLIRKQMKVNGIRKDQLIIDDDAIEEMISRYTREAGVRSLERKIGEICRKTALKIEEKGEMQIHVTKENLEDFIGRGKYTVNPAAENPEVGIVRGLAWTSVGGETLEVEVNIAPGKGECKLTGRMGDVMKESAEAGVSYVRSVAPEYQVQPDFFEKHDIHVHIPEGAVPKDGPSAGITMATAILSAVTQIPVRCDLAMTGEITLRGRVLPIGGLKEKLLAAKKAGIGTVLVPDKNEPDVREFDGEITDGIEIRYVSTMQEVLQSAFVRQ